MAILNWKPNATIAVLEKEKSVAAHQTRHNSGVIHSGIYYRPGSYKAKLTKKGNEAMYRFCHEHGIEAEMCGKVIVANMGRRTRSSRKFI